MKKLKRTIQDSIIFCVALYIVCRVALKLTPPPLWEEKV